MDNTKWIIAERNSIYQLPDFNFYSTISLNKNVFFGFYIFVFYFFLVLPTFFYFVLGVVCSVKQH